MPKTPPSPTGRLQEYMRAFAAAWPQREVVQEPLARITWSHNLELLQRLDDRETRLWYARATAHHGWSRNVLVPQVESRAHHRQGKAISNFGSTRLSADSDLAAQVFKDPYLFDLLGTADPRREREVEEALVDQIQRFPLGLGEKSVHAIASAGKIPRLTIKGPAKRSEPDQWIDAHPHGGDGGGRGE